MHTGTPLLVILVLFLSATTACGQKSTDKVKNIDIETFDKLRAKDKYVVLDVRTPEEWAAGTIEDAVEIDFFGEEFDAELKNLDTSMKYLVYCRSGRRSAKTVQKMQTLGFKHVMNLEGGYIEWSKKHQE